MKKVNRFGSLLALLAICLNTLFTQTALGHGVQVAWTVMPDTGFIRVYIEHWHGQGGTDPIVPQPSDTIEVKINGGASQFIAFTGEIDDTPIGSLPGGPTSISIDPDLANNYNDWGYWDFPPGICNQVITVEIVDGTTVVFAEDDPILYPVTISHLFSDIAPPVISGTDVSQNANGCTTGVVIPDSALNITLLDDCDPNPTFTVSNVPAGNLYPIGDTTVTVTATDANGNQSTEDFTVTVVPTDVAPPAVTILGDNPLTVECPGPFVDPGVSVTDDCDPNPTVVVTMNGDPSNGVGSFTVDYVVTDSAGFVTTVTRTVNVVDTTPPVAVAVPTLTIELGNGGNFAPFGHFVSGADVEAGSTDSCGILNTFVDPGFFTCADVGQTINATYFVLDAAGNQGTTPVDIVVVDTVPPDALVQNISINLDASGNASITAADVDAGSSDICLLASISLDRTDFTCADVLLDQFGNPAPVTVTFTATDAAGNTATAPVEVTVHDVTPPVAVAQNITVTLDGTGNATITGAQVDGGSTDNCALQFTVSPNTFNCSNIGDNNVTLTATDPSGNSATANAIVTVVGGGAIAITNCPGDITFECDGAGNTADINGWLNSFAANDPCGGSVTLSNDYAGLTGACGATGSALVTFTADDGNGNVVSCTGTVTVLDTTPPNISGAASALTLSCGAPDIEAQINAWLASGGGAIANDACGSITWSDDYSGLTAVCGSTGSATVTFTATDECGNSSTTSAVVSTIDNTAPSIDTAAANSVAECDGAGNAADLNSWLASNGGAVASDACGSVTWTNDFSALSDDCGATGSTTVTFTATDECGNSSTTAATFTIQDTVPPVVGTGAADLTVESDGGGNTADLTNWLNSFGGASASDACGGVTWSNDFGGSLSDLCGETGSATVTFTATDDCGNASDTTATFTIEDTTPPSITTAAGDSSVECDGNGNSGDLNAWLSSNGGAVAGEAVTWSNDFSALSDDCGGTGSASVTFTATDDCGNSSTTTSTFAIVDTTAPVVGSPAADLTVESDGAGNAADLTNWLSSIGGASASDACGGVTWSNDFGGLSDLCGDTGSATVTFTATDDCGNTSDTTATFTIEDTTPPTITTAAGDTSVECDGNGNAGDLNAWLSSNGGAAAGEAVTWSNDFGGLSDGCGATGSATVTFTATDDCGNSSTTTSTFAIVDTTAPVVGSPAADLTVESDGAGNAAALSNWLSSYGGASASDACGGVTWSNDFGGLSDLCGETGSATVTFTATDDCGNSSDTTATFTIEDTTPPTITAAAGDTSVECDGNGNAADLNAWLSSNGGAAAGEAVTWTNDFSALSDDCGGTGSATVTFTATDDCGNSSTTTSTFAIVDTSAPVVGSPAADLTVEADGAGNAADLNNWLSSNGGASASDACGGVTWSNDFGGLSDLCGDTGSATVTFTATDDCGNTSNTVATFTIEDTTPPTIDTAASDSGAECDGSGNTAELNAWLASNGGANTGEAVTWSNNFSALSDDCGSTGSATVTFTATDDCGNSSVTTATFTVVDTTAPVISVAASGSTVECDGNGNTADLNAWLQNNGGASATDDCSGLTWSNDYNGLSDGCGSTGSATVTFTATDDCGNSTSTTATFTVEDTTAPSIDAAASSSTVEADGSGNNGDLQAWLASNGGASASDPCGSVTWSNDYSALSDACGATGSVTVTFTATDDCGNSDSTSATFTIEDTQAPSIDTAASDQTIECNGGSDAQLQAWLASNGGASASDQGGSVTWSNNFSTLSDDCGNTGSAEVTFTATDECGNASTTTASFTIQDTAAPSIGVAASDATVECGGTGIDAEIQAWLDSNGGASATDNCGDVTWANNYSGLSGSCGASVDVTFTATDSCGNSSTTTASISIVDNTPPTIETAASDLNVECDGLGNAGDLQGWLDTAGSALASDNCGSITWSNDFAYLSDDCSETGTATVTFTATDSCGNQATTTATFTIADTTEPDVSCELQLISAVSTSGSTGGSSSGSSKSGSSSSGSSGSGKSGSGSSGGSGGGSGAAGGLYQVVYDASDVCSSGITTVAEIVVDGQSVSVLSGDQVILVSSSTTSIEVVDGVLTIKGSSHQLNVTSVDDCGNQSQCSSVPTLPEPPAGGSSSGSSGKSAKSASSGSSGKSAKSASSGSSAKSAKSGSSAKSAKSAKSGSSAKSAKSAKSGSSAKSAKSKKSGSSAKSAMSAKSGSNGKSVKNAKSGSAQTNNKKNNKNNNKKNNNKKKNNKKSSKKNKKSKK